MSALSDHLDTIKVLVDPPASAVDITVAMGGGPTIAVNINIRFDAENAVELWNFDVLQFRGDLNVSETENNNRIQWDFGKKAFSFQKVPDSLWSVRLDEIEGRGATPELALVDLLT